MNKSESKYFNTAVRMDKAFLELLSKKDFEYITVKEICEKAGVNRSTFYLHYETIGDLLEECISYVNEHFSSYFKNINHERFKDIDNMSFSELYLMTPEYLMPYLSYIKENKKLFLTALQKFTPLGLERNYKKMFDYIFNPILDKFSIPENERKYVMAFYIEGIIAIIKEWLKSDCKESVEYMIKIILRHFEFYSFQNKSVFTIK